ncbi:MAG: hypothetical protein RL152_906, partial [Bacteroidota bacterium]
MSKMLGSREEACLPVGRGTGIGMPVAIQGYEGSFHQVAARSFYGKNVQILPCATFTDVIKEASNK